MSHEPLLERLRDLFQDDDARPLDVRTLVTWALSDLRMVCDAHDLAFHQADRDAYQLYQSERSR